MTDTLARTGIVVPAEDGGDTVDVPRDVRAIASWLEDHGLILLAPGPMASRPAPGVVGRLFKSTSAPEDNTLWWDTGVSWVSIGSPAQIDAAAGVGSLRTLGSGALQAAAGNHTHAITSLLGVDAAVALAQLWARPGVEVPGQATAVTQINTGTATIVSAPSAGRRIIKTLWIAVPLAGTVVTLTLAGTVVARIPFVQPAQASLGVCWPIGPGETVQATVSGGGAVIVSSYGDRADAVLNRLGLVSGTTSGTLIAAGTARTITHLWLANASASADTTVTLSIGSPKIVNALVVPASRVVTLDDPITITADQAVSWSGDAAAPITILAVGH